MRISKFIPRSLYKRFLLIIILPILILQLVTIYVFYYVHLDVVKKHMVQTIIEEIDFIRDNAFRPEYNQFIHDLSNQISVSYYQKGEFIDDNRKKLSLDHNYDGFFGPLTDPLYQFKLQLSINQGSNPYKVYQLDDFLEIEMMSGSKTLVFIVPIKKVVAARSLIFIIWVVLISLITSLIAILFLRNQIRPISNLKEVAESFGRGQNDLKIQVGGSEEVRSLALSFIKMQERVARQISQRTDMLSAVSHDLRTPLTRAKLQLEMMEDSAEVRYLKSDIDDMGKLVDEYLDFASNNEKEGYKMIKVRKFLQDEIIGYYSKLTRKIKYDIDIDSSKQLLIRKLTFKRALTNLINNSLKYARNILFSAKLSNKNLIIMVEDDGPGIPTFKRKKVFNPFYRLDTSRNLDDESDKGSGLGLSIVLDSITSHGGRVKLGDSKKMGGLLVTIYIPL